MHRACQCDGVRVHRTDKSDPLRVTMLATPIHRSFIWRPGPGHVGLLRSLRQQQILNSHREASDVNRSVLARGAVVGVALAALTLAGCGTSTPEPSESSSAPSEFASLSGKLDAS